MRWCLWSTTTNDQQKNSEGTQKTVEASSILLWCISGPTTNDQRRKARVHNKRANHKAFCAGVCRNHRTMINEAHREYVLSAPWAEKKVLRQTKRSPETNIKMDLTRKRGWTTRNRSIWAVCPDKIYCSFSVFFAPFATHPSAPALSVLLALSSILCALSRCVLSVPLSLCSDGLIEFVWRGSLLF